MHSYLEFEVVYIVYHILLGLQYLHKRAIVHRDIKPENILLELDNEKENIVTLKLVDFGLSVILQPGNTLNDACGTPAFVAPEIIKRVGYNHAIDMWSLGIITFLLYLILYIMLNRIRRRLPFNGKEKKELFEMLCNSPIEYDSGWKDFSPNCSNFVKGLLIREYSQRLTAQQALEHPWITSNIEVILMCNTK